MAPTEERISRAIERDRQRRRMAARAAAEERAAERRANEAANYRPSRNLGAYLRLTLGDAPWMRDVEIDAGADSWTNECSEVTP